LELDLHGTVPVWFKGDFEDVRVILKMLSHLHEVDVVVEAEIGVDHDNSERVNGDLVLHFQKSLEDVGQLGDDPLTVKEIAAASHLDGPVGEHLDRLGAVRVVVREGDLVVKGGRLQLPLEATISLGSGSLQLERLQILKNCTKPFNINLLDKA